MECNFCKKTFLNKYTLSAHQKSAKYCLKLQNKNNTKFKCEDCEKVFSSKHNLSRHEETCDVRSLNLRSTVKTLETERDHYKEKYTDLVEEFSDMKQEYERKIEILQDKLENIAVKATQKSTNTTNNVTNYNKTQLNTLIEKLDNITQAHVNSQAENLTLDHIKNGAKGYVEYAMNFPLKNSIICVDYARRKVQFKNEAGDAITDPDTNIIAQMLFESIEPKNTQLALDYGNSLPDDMDAERRMRILADMAGKIANVREGANGGKNDLVHNVIRGICGKSVLKGAI